MSFISPMSLDTPERRGSCLGQLQDTIMSSLLAPGPALGGELVLLDVSFSASRSTWPVHLAEPNMKPPSIFCLENEGSQQKNEGRHVFLPCVFLAVRTNGPTPQLARARARGPLAVAVGRCHRVGRGEEQGSLIWGAINVDHGDLHDALVVSSLFQCVCPLNSTGNLEVVSRFRQPVPSLSGFALAS